MQGLRYFFGSPLARHPFLLGRKIASRVRPGHRKLKAQTPDDPKVEYPPGWGTTLHSWTRQFDLRGGGAHSFSRVFRQDFDESMLLRLCRDGPRPFQRDLTGDIKLIWDYSRAHPLFTNAALGPHYVEECRAFTRRWFEFNRDFDSPSWTCAMDVAIRAVNWIFADVLFNGELGRRFGADDWAFFLWQHGYVIWNRLEARLISSNHYLADVVGLLIIGAIFPGDSSADRWRRFAETEFPRALLAQTRPDGGLNEASLRYHAFVTEMALVARLSIGRPFPETAERRLDSMCQIVADFRDSTGDVFPIGDDDGGRMLAIDLVAPIGRADVLLSLAFSVLKRRFQNSDEAVYKDSGWWMRRAGEFVVALDFGGVGHRGLGSHAHNDDFSFCLEWGKHPVIIDPGTFLYTPDVEARNRFRSTFSHNTIVVGGAEQRLLSTEPFSLIGQDCAFSTRQLDQNTRAFTRRIGRISHTREVSVKPDKVTVRDSLEGKGVEHVQWLFQLSPEIGAEVLGQGFELRLGESKKLNLGVSGIPLSLQLQKGDCSPFYGTRQPTLTCEAHGTIMLPFSVEWTISPTAK